MDFYTLKGFFRKQGGSNRSGQLCQRIARFLKRRKPHLYSCEGWWFCPEFLTIPDIMDGISLSIISWESSRRQRSAAVAIQHFSSGGRHRPRPSPGTGARHSPALAPAPAGALLALGKAGKHFTGDNPIPERDP